MSEVFGKKYVELYDLIYADKNYESECDFIEDVFKKFKTNVKSILDFGCGTGKHMEIFKTRGYEVFGVDKSEFMVIEAKKRGLNVELFDFVWTMPNDKLHNTLNKKFDACISMFDVASYLVYTNEFLMVLEKIRKLLHYGDPFIFQYWNGPAVLLEKPKRVEKRFKGGVRIASSDLRAMENLCDVDYNILFEGKVLVHEIHQLRYFFPVEIMHYLDDCGFRLLRICPLGKANEKATEKDWTVVAIAEAV